MQLTGIDLKVHASRRRSRPLNETLGTKTDTAAMSDPTGIVLKRGLIGFVYRWLRNAGAVATVTGLGFLLAYSYQATHDGRATRPRRAAAPPPPRGCPVCYT